MELPVFDSLTQCSAATGIPLGALKHAKKNGCNAFRSNRVYLADFLKWHFAERQQEGESLPTLEVARTLETMERTRILTIERKEKEGSYVDFSKVKTVIIKTFQPINDHLSALPSGWASKCNPTDPQLAREALEEWLRIVRPLIRQSWPSNDVP